MTAEQILAALPPGIALRIDASEGGCWPCSGWHNDAGYAYAMTPRPNRRAVPVHRLVMAALGHDVDGLEIDHLCRNRDCVNPNHLEVVTHAENMRRTRRNSCRRAGHDWSDPRNVYVRPNGRRYCAECSRQDQRKARRREAA